jgi:hypothetical protein
VILLVASKSGDDLLDRGGDAVALALAVYGNEHRERFAVFAQECPLEERNPLRGHANGVGFFAGFGGRPHEPFEPHHPRPPLRDVVDGGEGEEILAAHTVDLLDGATQGMDPCKGRRIEDAVRVSFVHHAHDNQVVEPERLLGFVVPQPGALVGREHVFRIGVDDDARDLAAQRSNEHGQHQKDHPRVLDRPVDERTVWFHRTSLGRLGASGGSARLRITSPLTWSCN